MKHDNANANANAPLLAHSASTQQNRVIILERWANGRCANGTCAGLRAVAQIQISQAARFHSPTKPTSRSVKHASLAQALAPQPAAFIPSRLLAFFLPAVPPRDFKSMVPVPAGVTVHLGAGCAVHARAALLVRFLHALRWR
jgi:hypothetical protein